MVNLASLVRTWPLLALGAAIAIPEHHVVHEKRGALHPRWTKLERVEGHKVFQMRVGLTQTGLEGGYEKLMDVSDPASPNFGKHWTADEVISAFQPTAQTEDAVRKWLVDGGIDGKRITHSENKGWFAFFATAAEAESLLATEFHEYQDSQTNGIIPACDAYYLPAHIREHVDYVTPGIRLMAPEGHREKKRRSLEKSGLSKKKTASKAGLEKRIVHDLLRMKTSPPTKPDGLETCDQYITPACIRQLYGVTVGNSSVAGNSLGIFESELQWYTQQDLDLFFSKFATQIPNGTHPIAANVDGGQQNTLDPYYAGGEADLDLMMAYPIVYPQTLTLYDVDDYIVQANPNDTYTFGFNTFLDALDGSYCNFTAYNETGDDPNLDQAYPDPASGGWGGDLQCGIYKPTNVISLSYGGMEADIPVTYQKRQCLEYLKLGLQGVSFLFASGDSGVSNYPEAVGGIDGPTGCLGPNLNIFNPTWPNNCPYVTNVGATKVYPGFNASQPESAVFDPAGTQYSVNYSSGGGFSNVYGIPQYQQAAISTFFADHDPGYPYYSGLVSNSTDITTKPDVAGLAGNGSGIYNRIGRGIPDVAANGDNGATYVGANFELVGGTSQSAPIFAAIVNRLNEARIGAGKGPIGFLNPSLYANPGMLNDITNGSNPGCNTIGFSAVKGWDPVTGLGTPNFPKMLEYYMSLP